MPDLQLRGRAAPRPVPSRPRRCSSFQLRVDNAEPARPIHTVALRCQIQIEATRRRYAPEEQARLADLFGEPERWGQTLRTMLWTHASAVVPPFTGDDRRSICRCLHLRLQRRGDEVFLRRSTTARCRSASSSAARVFYEDADGALQVAPISWSKEARFRLPVASLAAT